ncbi:MAG: hypothetical protein ACI9YH_004555 [Colwellia sp.]|jgi:hypothetical protein
MFSIYQLYCMNNQKLNFRVKRNTWGNLAVTIDRIDNIIYSANDWRCDSYTKNQSYENYGYGEIIVNNEVFRTIGCGGNYSWLFAEDIEYDEKLLRKPKDPSVKGLKTQKARKEYKCYHCKEIISKGQLYERYEMRSAGKFGPINEVFCIGHRDKMREEYFDKSSENIKYQQLIDTWNDGILI